MRLKSLLSRCAFVLALLSIALLGHAKNSNDAVPQIWQMLDYLATDYAEAVEDGKIIDAEEYEEMQEFSVGVYQRLQGLSEEKGKAQLLSQAQGLVQLVEKKGPVTKVYQQAHELADALLRVYPIATSPEQLPDVSAGAALYQAHCASCHGVTGNADGPAAKGLEPAAIAFTDVERADQRSPLSLFQTATLGVEGTSMVAYAGSLTDAERWALAYYIGAMAYKDVAAEGKALWNDNAKARAQVGNLDALSSARVDQIASVLGREKARALIGYLRANPAKLAQSEH